MRMLIAFFIYGLLCLNSVQPRNNPPAKTCKDLLGHIKSSGDKFKKSFEEHNRINVRNEINKHILDISKLLEENKGDPCNFKGFLFLVGLMRDFIKYTSSNPEGSLFTKTQMLSIDSFFIAINDLSIYTCNEIVELIQFSKDELNEDFKTYQNPEKDIEARSLARQNFEAKFRIIHNFIKYYRKGECNSLQIDQIETSLRIIEYHYHRSP